MTDPKLYSVELGRQRCASIVQELQGVQDKATGQSLLHCDTDTGCVLYTGKLTKDGHWQIQRRPRYFTRPSHRAGENHHRAYYVHRIAYVALHGIDVVYTASHLCGRGNCINPMHVYDEPIGMNVARINCLGYVDCPLHGHRLATLCTHTPPCIKKPIPADNCCLSIDQADLDDSSPATPPAVNTPPGVANFDDFLRLLPSESDWPSSPEDVFDTGLEIATPGATPPVKLAGPVVPPPPRSPLSPPPWHFIDVHSSQDPTTGSDFTDHDAL